MKQPTLRLFLLSFLLSALVPLTAQQESIQNFVANLVVSPDGSVEVTEEITVVATGDQIKRGITRALHRKPIGDAPGMERFTYEVISVSRNGQSIDHTAKNEDGNRVHYLGDKDTKIPPGTYTFRFRYRSPHQIYFMEGIEEIRWPLIGVDNQLPVAQASITVQFPGGTQLLNSACYTGPEGSRASDCRVEQGSNSTIFTLGRPLSPKEGMTVSVGVPRGTFVRPTPPPPPTPLQRNATLWACLFGLLAGLFYGYDSWKKHGVDPIGPPVAPRFTPPADLSPAAVSFVSLGIPHQPQVTASLTDLAIKGYIVIEEVEKPGFLGIGTKEMFVIHRGDRPARQAEMHPEQFVLCGQLFSDGDTVELDGTYNKELNAATEAHGKTLKNHHGDFVKDGANGKHTLPLLGIFVITVVAAIAFLGHASGLGIGIFIGTVVLYIAGMIFHLWLIRKPSLAKVITLGEIKGMRQYFKLKEKERRSLPGAPAMTEAHFQELLPYAIALGENNNWAADLATDWANSSTRSQHHYPYYYPSFSQKLGTSYQSTAYQASSGGGSYSGGGGSVGGGGGTGGF